MSVVLNLACLGFSTVIIGYTVVSGILNTAHEGNVMGKAYSSMWVPLRTTIAIALMLPLSDGFCIMQHGVLWVAKTGLAVAYHTWSAAVDHLQNNGTLYAPPVNRTGEKLAAAIMRNSACLDIINRSHGEMKVGRVNEAKNNSDEYTLKVRYTGNGRPLTDYFPYASNGGFKDWVEIDGCGTASITFQKPDQDDLSYPIKIQ
jgi:conjugal transfer/type IV secretion protein DotA/TraY